MNGDILSGTLADAPAGFAGVLVVVGAASFRRVGGTVEGYLHAQNVPVEAQGLVHVTDTDRDMGHTDGVHKRRLLVKIRFKVQAVMWLVIRASGYFPGPSAQFLCGDQAHGSALATVGSIRVASRAPRTRRSTG